MLCGTIQQVVDWNINIDKKLYALDWVLEQMRLFHLEAMLDDDYIKEYYLDSEQIYHQGGITLVAKAMFPWALSTILGIRLE